MCSSHGTSSLGAKVGKNKVSSGQVASLGASFG